MEENTLTEARAGIVLVTVIAVFSLGLLFSAQTQVLVLLNIFLIGILSLLFGFKWQQVEKAMVHSVGQAIGSILIIFLVGVIISSWIQCGTIPMLIYYGLGLVNVRFFVPLCFLLSAFFSILTGTSWGTAGTIGVALAGIGASVGMPLPLVAGAVVSGSLVGDKCSPLSDSTILAAQVAHVDVYEHIRSMLYTTIPSCAIALALYYFAGLRYLDMRIDTRGLAEIQSVLAANYRFHWLLLIPPALILVMSVLRISAILTMMVSGAAASLLALLFQGRSFENLMLALNQGFASATGNQLIDSLLSRGGIQSMMSTVSLIVLALAMGGILDELGYLKKVVHHLTGRIHSDRLAVIAVLLVGVVTLMFSGALYIAIVLMGSMFRQEFEARGIKNSVLSRSIEESTTIICPLIPWNVSAPYYASVLGVGSLAYIPFCFYNWVNPLLSILFAACGVFLFKKGDKRP